jgi:hypothetical protein
MAEPPSVQMRVAEADLSPKTNLNLLVSGQPTDDAVIAAINAALDAAAVAWRA